MSAAAGSRSRCGSNFATPSTVCHAAPSLMIRLFVCTVGYPQNSRKWNKLQTFHAPVMSQTRDYYVISSGLTQTQALRYVKLPFVLLLVVFLYSRLHANLIPWITTFTHPMQSNSILLGLGRKRSRCLVHLWRRCRPPVPSSTRSWLGGQSSPSCRGRLRIFRWPRTGHCLFSAQLLWRVWQRRGHDDCWWHSNVFFPNPETSQCRAAKRRRIWRRTPGNTGPQVNKRERTFIANLWRNANRSGPFSWFVWLTTTKGIFFVSVSHSIASILFKGKKKENCNWLRNYLIHEDERNEHCGWCYGSVNYVGKWMEVISFLILRQFSGRQYSIRTMKNSCIEFKVRWLLFAFVLS